MYAENLTIHCGCQWQVVKQVCELLPYDEAAVLALALNLKPVDLSDLPRFVIASQKEEPVWEPKFEQNQVRNCFNRGGSSVHIVPQEEVIRVRHFTSNSKQLDHIEELAMYIAYNCYW